MYFDPLYPSTDNDRVLFLSLDLQSPFEINIAFDFSGESEELNFL